MFERNDRIMTDFETFLQDNSETIFRYFKYKKVWTPYELDKKFSDESIYENGGYAGRDAQGNKLVGGTVASNVYPFGTTFVFEGRTFTVRDRGGSNFNSYNRLDVFVPRLQGESNAAYKARISHYGVRTVTMYKQ